MFTNINIVLLAEKIQSKISSNTLKLYALKTKNHTVLWGASKTF